MARVARVDLPQRSVLEPLYARAGIAEVWLVNLPEEQVELYASPVNAEYQTTQTFKRGDEARSQTLGDLSLSVSDLLG